MSELAAKKKRLVQITGQIDRIVENIMNGKGSKGVTSDLGDLKAEQDSLEAEVCQREAQTGVFLIHNIGQVYRSKIRQLTDRLNDRAIRLKAIETIQGLIHHIEVTPTNTGFDIEPHGTLAAIIEMVDQIQRTPRS